MTDLLSVLMDGEGFMPHGHCYLWTPSLLWTYVISDAAIAASYFSIPVALQVFLKRRPDIPFHWVFVMFSMFIFACGMTHLISIWTIWHPAYWLDAGMKAVTAAASVATAVMLWPLLPRAEALTTTDELHRVIYQLEREIDDRKHLTEELKLRNQEIARKNLELEEASRTKSAFLANMSHELRTPLNAVIGFTGTLLMRLPGPLNSDQERQLNTIQTSSQHLLALINDLLDLSRIEAGRIDLQLETLEAQPILREIGESMRLLAMQKGLKFHLELPEEGVLLYSDRRAFKQIVLNLANNAVKFTDRGEVSLTLAARRDKQGRWAEVTVTDTGIGIPAEQQGKLFQAFQQLDPTSTRRFDGTGLGLYLSQKLARLLGAQISFSSEPEVGSAFILTMRAHDPVMEGEFELPGA